MTCLNRQNNVGQNFRRTKYFVGQDSRHKRKISSLLSDIVLSDKVHLLDFLTIFRFCVLNKIYSNSRLYVRQNFGLGKI